jgi:IS1 family transposase
MDARPLLMILLISIVLAGWRWRARSPSRIRAGVGRRWHWHPRTPDDCPCCRGTGLDRAPSATLTPSVRPWAEVKSRQGAPKRRPTAGYACPTLTCAYFGITDEGIHALIAYGAHGQRERISDLLCQACGTKFSAHRGSALYGLKTPSSQVGVVLSALAEGLDVGAAVRVFGYRETTITRWLTRAGQHAERLHQALLHDLPLPHVQLDEIRTRLRARERVLWLWVALDPLTKLVPAVHLGPRTQESAHRVVHAVRSVLTPGGVPVITSDGLRLYYYALTAHFGHWVRRGRRCFWQVAETLLYGQVQKLYRRRRLVRVRYHMRCGALGDLRGALQALGLSGRLNTAFVERVHLTLRGERGRPNQANLVHRTLRATPGPGGRLVARVLSLRAPASLVARGAADAAGARRTAPGAPLSRADARHGGGADNPAVDSGGAACDAWYASHLTSRPQKEVARDWFPQVLSLPTRNDRGSMVSRGDDDGPHLRLAVGISPSGHHHELPTMSDRSTPNGPHGLSAFPRTRWVESPRFGARATMP